MRPRASRHRSEFGHVGRDLAALESFAAQQPAREAEPGVDPYADESLYGYITRVSPHLQEPRHLAPLVDVLEQATRAAAGECAPVFAAISEPVQHGKTETIKHGLARAIARHPEVFCAYLSYSAERAQDQSRGIRDYAVASGATLRDDTKAVGLWRTPEGGGLAARGIRGGVTGLGNLSIIVVDDPFKNRLEAESRIVRDRVWSDFTASIWTRLRMRTSILLVQARWNQDDAIGRIRGGQHPELARLFKVINQPAISVDGTALWPDQMPLELLAIKRAASELDWWSLYMGEPRPRDKRVFDGITYYTEKPARLRIGIGTDQAYTKKSRSDWNVAIVMGECDRRYYVLDVMRRKCTAPEWLDELVLLRQRWGRPPTRTYVSGTEVGSIDFMRRDGLEIDARPASSDKYVRALPASAAWKKSDILWPARLLPSGELQPPSAESDLGVAIGVCVDFTGQGDACDDDVDALAAAYDLLKEGAGDESTVQPNVHRDSPYGQQGPDALPRIGRGRAKYY